MMQHDRELFKAFHITSGTSCVHFVVVLRALTTEILAVASTDQEQKQTTDSCNQFYFVHFYVMIVHWLLLSMISDRLGYYFVCFLFFFQHRLDYQF